MNTRPKIGAIKVGTTPKMLVDINPKRKALLIYNNGTANIELISSKDARYGDGIPIAPGVSFTMIDYCQGAYWLVAESEAQDVRFEEDVEADV
ncbi:MAG: hypothetical protein QMD13_09325 [Candidatus Bathyarchaeia archaeon]|nr:hypothetical protein [Candidatus Bathyarchaeia archaeon]